jgi:phosphonate transport system substrate-binding protein
VQASLHGKVVPLVQREEDSKFTSKFIVNAAVGAKSLKDLKGKSFAFGSASSTSGHLMPRYFLQKEGIKPETFFKNVAYSGAHDATVAWVASGKVDAGALNASVWDKLVESGKVDSSKVKLLATSPAFYDYNWTVRGNLDKKLQERISAAFLKLDPKTRRTRPFWTCNAPAASFPPRRTTTRASRPLPKRQACSSEPVV